MQMLVELTVYGELVPAAAAAVLTCLALRLAAPTRSAAGRWGAAVALTAGFVSGYALLDVPQWPPSLSWHWPPYVALLTACAGIAEALGHLPMPVCGAMRVGVVGIAAWLLTPQLLETAPNLWFWRVSLAVAMLAAWLSLAAWARRLPGLGFYALLDAITLAGAAVIVLAGSLRLAQPAGFLAAAIMGIGVVAWWRNEPTTSQGTVPGVAILLPGMMCNGYFNRGNVDLPMASCILVALAPILLALTGLSVQHLPARRWQAALLLFAALAPTALAVILAGLAGGNEI